MYENDQTTRLNQRVQPVICDQINRPPGRRHRW